MFLQTAPLALMVVDRHDSGVGSLLDYIPAKWSVGWILREWPELEIIGSSPLWHSRIEIGLWGEWVTLVQKDLWILSDAGPTEPVTKWVLKQPTRKLVSSSRHYTWNHDGVLYDWR